MSPETPTLGCLTLSRGGEALIPVPLSWRKVGDAPREVQHFAKEGIGNAVIIIFALEIVRILGIRAPQNQQAGDCACRCLLVAQDKRCRYFVNRARSTACICLWSHSTTVLMLVVSRLGDVFIGETFPPPKGGGPAVIAP